MSARPVWIRLPARGAVCPWTGLSAPSMRRLSVPMPSNKHNPPVRSVLMDCTTGGAKRPGKKGVRLINLESLLAHIERHAEEAASL